MKMKRGKGHWYLHPMPTCHIQPALSIWNRAIWVYGRTEMCFGFRCFLLFCMKMVRFTFWSNLLLIATETEDMHSLVSRSLFFRYIHRLVFWCISLIYMTVKINVYHYLNKQKYFTLTLKIWHCGWSPSSQILLDIKSSNSCCIIIYLSFIEKSNFSSPE